jgi:hypothetical protein
MKRSRSISSFVTCGHDDAAQASMAARARTPHIPSALPHGFDQHLTPGKRIGLNRTQARE